MPQWVPTGQAGNAAAPGTRLPGLRRRGRVSPNAAGDFERCLELGGTDLRSDELFATLTAFGGYYAMQADLPRVATLLESVRRI